MQLDNRAGTRVLNGVSDFVIHADSAELLLVLARSGGSAGLECRRTARRDAGHQHYPARHARSHPADGAGRIQ